MKNNIHLVDDVDNALFITHSGPFHADDVMATAILSLRYNKRSILLARVKEIDARDVELGICYDIGGGKFDHHQKGGNGARDNGVPYASAGLIWKSFGRMTVFEYSKFSGDELNSEELDKVQSKVDCMLIQGIDAVDCGDFPSVDYPTQGTSISAAIKAFNPCWGDIDQSFDKAFIKAVEFSSQVLENTLRNAISAVLAEKKCAEKIQKSSGGILILDESLPWLSPILHADEKIKEKANEIMYAIFPGERGGWMWRAVPTSPVNKSPFRNPTPESWCGLKGELLQQESGIKDAIFVHPSGFIGSCESKDGAIEMVKRMIYLGNKSAE